MSRVILRNVWWATIGASILGLLSLSACSSAPVVVNKAVAVKAVDTTPIKKSLTVTKEKTASAVVHAEAATAAVVAAEAAIPVSTFSVEQLLVIQNNFTKARNEIIALRTDLNDAQASTATALEQRAAAQEVADAQRQQNTQLVEANNAAKGEIAALSRRADQASARGHVYLMMLLGLSALVALYAVAKFYFHVPFL